MELVARLRRRHELPEEVEVPRGDARPRKGRDILPVRDGHPTAEVGVAREPTDSRRDRSRFRCDQDRVAGSSDDLWNAADGRRDEGTTRGHRLEDDHAERLVARDRKSTRLNSSHITISYAVFCL